MHNSETLHALYLQNIPVIFLTTVDTVSAFREEKKGGAKEFRVFSLLQSFIHRGRELLDNEGLEFLRQF